MGDSLLGGIVTGYPPRSWVGNVTDTWYATELAKARRIGI
jgi:hypothetical protein